MAKKKKVALLILDGWGYGRQDHSNAIFEANTPIFDGLLAQYPNAQLRTDGENVGLPEGQMGNSEVGHLNIGAGRVVYQDLVKINKAIADGSFAANETLLSAFNQAKKNKLKVHLMGLLSDGGIHSHQNQLHALCDLAKKHELNNVFIHAFTDGRDTDPHSGIKYLESLEKHIENGPCQIASVCGRYYAMDRDLRWERVKKAYDALVHGIGHGTSDLLAAIKTSYDNGQSDEFIEPIIVKNQEGNPLAKIEEGDVVICFNFRTDRCREITRALSQEDFRDFGMKRLDLKYLTMTKYDSTFTGVEVMFEKDNLNMTLGETLSKAGKTQLRIAETEKYPHVSFFFSGGREETFSGESRIMVPSPKVATYDLQPEMSAPEVCAKVIGEIQEHKPDFICLNFANPDMVGHTGVYSAIKTAVETVDKLMGKIVEAGLKEDYSFVIIADHGNADYAVNEDGSPNTAHSTNPVPVITIDSEFKKIKNGKLADIAPSILKMMHIPIPKEMNGEVLISE